MRFVALPLTLIYFVSLSVAGQASSEKFGPVEEQQVKSFVKSFSRRISRTTDLTPYLTTPAAKSVLNTVFEDGETLSAELLARTRHEDLERFYVAMINLSYLSELYVYTRVYLKNGGLREVPHEQQYPLHVYQSLRRNETVAAWWIHDSQEPLRTMDQLRGLTNSFERAAAMIRRHFNAYPPEQNRVYRKNLSWLRPELKPFRVTPCDSKEGCAGFPIHSQFIDVELPVLSLRLVRAEGKLQILMVGLLEGIW
jgi:hypothetical protein